MLKKIASFVPKCFKRAFSLQNWKNRSKGGILMEFAISVPVLIMITYYVHDLPKYARMQKKMEFCAHCFVSMLQNISHGEKITRQHIKNALSAAYVVVFPGKTEYGTGSRRMPLGYFPHAWIYCVKGLPNGKASVVWMSVPYIDNTSVSDGIH